MRYVAPRIHREDRTFYPAEKIDGVLAPWCDECKQWRPLGERSCGFCGTTLIPKETSVDGTLLAYSVIHRTHNPLWREETPFAICAVRMSAGPMIIAQLAEMSPNSAYIGMKVVVRYVETDRSEVLLPVFVPEDHRKA